MVCGAFRKNNIEYYNKSEDRTTSYETVNSSGTLEDVNFVIFKL